MRHIALAFLLTGMATAAGAQSIGQPLPGRAAPSEAYSKPNAAPPKGSRPCPEYGAGFVRMEGSTFCVRVGGAVRAEFGKSSRNGYGSRSGYGSNAAGMVYLESRGQTAFGPVRSVLSVQGSMDRGLDSRPFRY